MVQQGHVRPQLHYYVSTAEGLRWVLAVPAKADSTTPIVKAIPSFRKGHLPEMDAHEVQLSGA